MGSRFNLKDLITSLGPELLIRKIEKLSNEQLWSPH